MRTYSPTDFIPAENLLHQITERLDAKAGDDAKALDALQRLIVVFDMFAQVLSTGDARSLQGATLAIRAYQALQAAVVAVGESTQQYEDAELNSLLVQFAKLLARDFAPVE